jgi:hypothetical protein
MRPSSKAAGMADRRQQRTRLHCQRVGLADACARDGRSVGQGPLPHLLLNMPLRSPAWDTVEISTVEVRLGTDDAPSRLVGQAPTELAVDLGLVGRVRVCENGQDVAERG